MVMEFYRDKCVLITGGSSGIGLAMARALRSSGAHLVLVARDEGKLEAARQTLLKTEASGEVHTTSVDVSDEEAVKALAADVPGGRPVDVLVCNAGVVMPGHFLELPQEQFDAMMSINFLGAVYLCRAFLPAMVERGSGDIHLVSSLAGLMGVFGYTAYSASKFALRGFAEVLRCEMKPRGIRVTASYPPDTDTPQLAFEDQYKPDETRAIAGNAKKLTADVVANAILQGIAAGRFHIVPGGSAKFADVMGRWFPGMVRGMFDSDVKKVQNKGAAQA
jgi:3-dehydrosphinganine reductase